MKLMSITASNIIYKRIQELEEMLELMYPLKNNNKYNRDFYRYIKNNLEVNREIYAHLVHFTADNLIH